MQHTRIARAFSLLLPPLQAIPKTIPPQRTRDRTGQRSAEIANEWSKFNVCCATQSGSVRCPSLNQSHPVYHTVSQAQKLRYAKVLQCGVCVVIKTKRLNLPALCSPLDVALKSLTCSFALCALFVLQIVLQPRQQNGQQSKSECRMVWEKA